ncbi:MAG TPA: ABC transporter ATP-binding protein [Gaiellaceae bacterium]|jgi:iron(III) transport system ATP-binding protein|nr:ABC transporter ATP-binding protein [Gaiellaceae bacterium]
MDEMIRLRGVSRRFGAVRAVERADLEVGRGEFVALLGPSGCGKTTLLRLIAGFERPDEGTVELAGRPVAGPAWVPPERRHVGMVFQDYALFPHLTVAENVAFGVPREGRVRRVAETLALVGLSGHAGRYPHELSGGQQQRAALARALAPEPAVVLLDEPWSNIDPLLRASMREELAGILRGAGVTVLLVTHEQEEAFSVADRIALMQDGRIEQTAAPEEIYYRPASRWAAEFVGTANVLRGRVGGGRVETAVGSFDVGGTNGHEAVDVLVRPELLELTPDPCGEGEVVARQFRGHDVFYEVRLGDGTRVFSQRPSNEHVPLGIRVSLRAHDGRVALLS